MKINQEQRVIDYIKEFGSITSLEAFKEIGITRLSAKIFNLKKMGFKITDKMEKGKNRYGEETNYKRYYIVSENMHTIK